MKKIFIQIIYKIFLFFDFLSGKILFFKIFEQFEKKSYIKKNFLNHEVSFFIPNQVIAWRVKTLFTQEPETIEWIKNIHQTMHETHFIEGHSMSTFSYNTDFEGKNLVSEQKYNIYGTSIDNLIEAKILKCPNYIKLDVDGIEHKILDGAKKTLMNNDLKSILVEVNENFQDQHKNIVKIMNENNFKLVSKNQNISDVQNTKFSKTFNYIYNR